MMSEAVPVNITKKVFNDVYIPYLDNLARTQIFYGGSSSGKSVFLAQRSIYDVLRGGRNYLVVRKVARTIKRSVFTEIKRVIQSWGLHSEFKINESDQIITCANGYQILFAGLDDIEKLKSIIPINGVVTDIWIEEATETTIDDIKQLQKRQRGGESSTPKRLTMSFNPILQSHWIYNEYFSKIAWADDQTEYNDGKLSIFKTWYIHNRFLTPDDIDDLESETDKYYYQVYTLGDWGVLGNVIFTNWEIADLKSMANQFTNRRNGLDFGFSSDPAAVVQIHYDKKKQTIYVFGEFYERGLTNDILADEVKKMIGHWHHDETKDEMVCTSTEPITCDSAEPKSIAELRNYGVNAQGAIKGKDSVNHGIQWLQQQKLIIDKYCINAKNEVMQYKWKEDKDGNAIRQPVDKNNHIIDAMRYALEGDSLRHEVTMVEDPFANW